MKRVALAIIAIVVAGGTFLSAAQPALASTFQPGKIINDGIFVNKNAMSLDAIRNFINAKGVDCIDGEAPCLKNFSEGGRSAAQIIYDAAQANDINPQALIVTLQKETGLLTKSGPGAWRYRTATGFGCPDTANCDALYYGFTNQIDNTANMYHKIMIDDPKWYTPYELGNNYIAWHPDFWDSSTNSWVDRCGGTNVYIENRATQALYSYTPYQPNGAALAAGYGKGDGCSSYGNRNFFNYFSDWFGSPTVDGRVYLQRVDTVGDVDGDAIRLGFRLNKRPSHSVSVVFRVENPSVVGIAGDPWVTIQPDNWDKPQNNIITFYGKNDGSGQTKEAYVTTTDVTSSDPGFNLLDGSEVEDARVTVMSGSRAVVRLYSPTLDRHIYTSQPSEIVSLVKQGYSDEGTRFYACQSGTTNMIRVTKGGGSVSLLLSEGDGEYRSAIAGGYTVAGSQFAGDRAGQIPVYRLVNSNSNYLYTTSAGERDYAVKNYGYKYEGVALNSCNSDDKPVYRLMHSGSGNHFFTTNPSERSFAGGSGYISEGVGFYAKPEGADSIPVYRLFNPTAQSHFYTTSLSEKDVVSKTLSEYVDEGVVFKMPNAGTLPVYRLYSAKKNDHFFTPFASEVAAAQKVGYVSEGIGLYTK